MRKKIRFIGNSLQKLIKEKNISLDEIILFEGWKILFPFITGNVNEDKILIQKHLLTYCFVKSLSIEENQFMGRVFLDKNFFNECKYLIKKQIIEKSYIIEVGVLLIHYLSKHFSEKNELYWINIRIILMNIPDLF